MLKPIIQQMHPCFVIRKFRVVILTLNALKGKNPRISLLPLLLLSPTRRKSLRRLARRKPLRPNPHRNARPLRNHHRLIAKPRAAASAACQIDPLHPVPFRPYPRDSTSTSQPRARSNSASAITTGVFPAPPADKLPTLITGHRSRLTRSTPNRRSPSLTTSPAA